MSAEASTCELVTIPISHYCEKARWALERAGVPYVERPHLLPMPTRPYHSLLLAAPRAGRARRSPGVSCSRTSPSSAGS